MTDAKQVRAIETVVEEANGKLPVMAGLGETGTSRAVPRAREMARRGVQFLSVLPHLLLFRRRGSSLRLFRGDRLGGRSSDLGLRQSGADEESPAAGQIAELRRRIPNIIGVKESNQDCANLQRLIALTRGDPEFSVLTGSEFLSLVGLQMGAHGCVGGLHNLCPRMVVGLYDAFRRGDLETARRRQTELIELWRIFNYGKIWGAFDEALRWPGICERATGSPNITALTEEERSKVHNIPTRYLGEQRGRVAELS